MVAGGHLFIVDADITRIDCDAWLLPTDARFWVTELFSSAAGMDGPGRLRTESWPTDVAFQPLKPEREPPRPWIWPGRHRRGRADNHPSPPLEVRSS